MVERGPSRMTERYARTHARNATVLAEATGRKKLTPAQGIIARAESDPTRSSASSGPWRWWLWGSDKRGKGRSRAGTSSPPPIVCRSHGPKACDRSDSRRAFVPRLDLKSPWATAMIRSRKRSRGVCWAEQFRTTPTRKNLNERARSWGASGAPGRSRAAPLWSEGAASWEVPEASLCMKKKES